MYEYKMSIPKSDNGAEVELQKRAAEGWRLVAAYARGGGGTSHVLIFERPRQ